MEGFEEAISCRGCGQKGSVLWLTKAMLLPGLRQPLRASSGFEILCTGKDNARRIVACARCAQICTPDAVDGPK